jgi:hypothetical protein
MKERTQDLGELYCDTRLGGVKRWYIGRPEEADMRIPDEMRKCVVFVGYRNREGVHCFAGTAFFVSRELIGLQKSFMYVVTAKHVIDKIRDKNCDKVCLRTNFSDGKARWVDTDIGHWIYHPDESQVVDIAAYPAALAPSMDHLTIPLSNFVTDEILKKHVGIGSEIFMAGLFANHHGQQRNIPIVRVGNIIAMPEEQVETSLGFMDAYLIEARSLGGISGSPVFATVRGFQTTETELGVSIGHADAFHLMGLMHGHWDLKDDIDADAVSTEDISGKKNVNMGIAIVVPSSKLLEVIRQPMQRKREDEVEKDLRNNRLPVADSLSEDEGFTKDTFEEALRRSSRKISPPDEEKKET